MSAMNGFGRCAAILLAGLVLHCSAQAADVVPLSFINDLPFVSVTIGAASTRLMFDSGGHLGISIPQATADQSGSVTLLDQMAKFSDLQGKIYEVHKLVAKQVVVGKTELGSVDGRIHRQWGGAPEGPEAELTKAREAGAIGLEAFGDHALMFDYRAGKLTIYAPGEVPQGGLQNWRALPLAYGKEGPSVTLLVNGKPLKFVLDTGARVNLVNAASLPPVTAKPPCSETTNNKDCVADGIDEVLDDKGRALGLRSVRQAKLDGAPFDGLLGAPFFQDYRVLLDAASHRLLLLPYEVNYDTAAK